MRQVGPAEGAERVGERGFSMMETVFALGIMAYGLLTLAAVSEAGFPAGGSVRLVWRMAGADHLARVLRDDFL